MNHPLDIKALMQHIGQSARKASPLMAKAPTQSKNKALLEIARLLRLNYVSLQQSNQRDIDHARQENVAVQLIDRLKLTDSTIETLAIGCEQLAAMNDPIGEMTQLKYQPSGIQVGQMRVPLGVFGMIYESRPNVTIEAASLSIKSGNACILRGGSEAIHTNQALTELIQTALRTADLPETAVQFIPTQDRSAVGELITMPEYVDVIIPRGGKSLIERISREARVPVIKHLDGNCHVYVDSVCNIEQAIKVVDNAKTNKYSPCNATESLLIHQSIALEFLPKIATVFANKAVEMRGCPQTLSLLKPFNLSNLTLIPATDADYFEEYLAPIISIKIVNSLESAIAHINHYSSHHTEAILTTDYNHALQFMREVDSASVMVNASTRFADGFEYGLGAEIGISTDKFHARGPVGLEGLTSLKWIVLGDGHIRG